MEFQHYTPIRRGKSGPFRASFFVLLGLCFRHLGAEGIRGQVAEQLVPRMVDVLLDLGNHGLHLGQNFGRIFVVHIALQKLEHVETVVVIADEVGE